MCKFNLVYSSVLTLNGRAMAVNTLHHVHFTWNTPNPITLAQILTNFPSLMCVNMYSKW